MKKSIIALMLTLSTVSASALPALAGTVTITNGSSVNFVNSAAGTVVVDQTTNTTAAGKKVTVTNYDEFNSYGSAFDCLFHKVNQNTTAAGKHVDVANLDATSFFDSYAGVVIKDRNVNNFACN